MASISLSLKMKNRSISTPPRVTSSTGSVPCFSILKMKNDSISTPPWLTSSTGSVLCFSTLKMKNDSISTPPRVTSSTGSVLCFSTLKMKNDSISTPPLATSSTGSVLRFSTGKHTLFSIDIGRRSASPLSKQRASPLYGDFEEELLKEYSIKDLEAATNSWSPKMTIGYGSTATVYRGSIGDHRVAVKVFFKDGKGNIVYQEAFEKEFMLLSKVRHENVIRLLCSCLEHGCLIYECLDCDLEDVLSRGVPWRLRLKIAHDIASGILFLHDCGFVHRDIKPANVLLSNAYEAKICDLGFSIPMSDTPSVVSGTFEYLDPTYRSTRIPRAYVDVYSFGLILIQLITGVEYPRKWITKENFAPHMIDPKAIDWPIPNVVSLANLAFRCLGSELADRPDLRHDILPELDQLMASD